MENEHLSVRRTPTIEEYKNLCSAVGWSDFMNFDVAEESLNQSLFGVVIPYKDEIVGMGRVVGDGNIYFYIQDVAVVPEHRNKGVGSMIMGEIKGKCPGEIIRRLIRLRRKRAILCEVRF